MFLQDMVGQYINVARVTAGYVPLAGHVLAGFKLLCLATGLHESLDVDDGLLCHAHFRCYFDSLFDFFRSHFILL